MRTGELRRPVAGHERLVDGLCAGRRVNGFHHVLHAEIEREHVLPGVRFHRVEDGLLAASDHERLGDAVDRQRQHLPLERPVVVPLIVGLVLEEPHEPAGRHVEGQRRVRVEPVVGETLGVRGDAERAGVVGLRRSEERQVESLVVTRRHPHRRPVAQVHGQPVPARPAGLARPGDGAETPGFGAGLRVQRHDEVAAGRAAGGANHDFPVGGERAPGDAVAGRGVGDRVIPHDIAGLHVQRHQVGVRRRHVQPVPVEREAALHRRRAVTRQPPRVLPEEVAGRRINRLHLVAEAVHEHHAVVHERRRFIGAVRQRPAPGETQIGHGLPIDLRERAEAHVLGGAAPRQPVPVGGVREHTVGDGGDPIQRIQPRRGRRNGHAGRQATARSARGSRDGRATQDRGISRQLTAGGRHAVLLRQIRQDLRPRHVAKTVGRRGRHAQHVLVQGVERLASKAQPEFHALERRRELAVVEIGAVARRAAPVVGRFALCGLGRREVGGRQRLGTDHAGQVHRARAYDARHRQEEQSRSFHGARHVSRFGL